MISEYQLFRKFREYEKYFRLYNIRQREYYELSLFLTLFAMYSSIICDITKFEYTWEYRSSLFTLSLAFFIYTLAFVFEIFE